MQYIDIFVDSYNCRLLAASMHLGKVKISSQHHHVRTPVYIEKFP